MRAPAIASLSLVVSALGGLLVPSDAAAEPDRRGFQSEITAGVSACIPGRAQCSTDGGNPDKGVDGALSGKTKPHAGLGVTLGFRPLPILMVGAAYNLGFFNPDYAVAGADVYRRATQHSVFAVARAILPVWRFDLGLELGPGWSRQSFRGTDQGIFDRVFSKGFAMKMGPVVDLYITRHLFVGAKADFIFNFHRQVCSDAPGESRVCARTQESDQAAVHQVIAGVHVGSTF